MDQPTDHATAERATTEHTTVEDALAVNPHLRTLRRIGVALIVAGVVVSALFPAITANAGSVVPGGFVVLVGILVLTSITVIRALRWER